MSVSPASEDTVHRICSNCIMDTTDPAITFDERGVCDYCHNYHENILPNWHPDEQGRQQLLRMADAIRKERRQSDYDCIIGLSGGMDSSYVAYTAKEQLGLRPLLFHVDTGWNTDTSVTNIQRLVEGLGLDLYTEVVDWMEIKDLHLAFFKAQLANIDIPQEVALFSALYRYAVGNGHRYVLTGGNYSTECVREPHEWGAYYPTDLRFVRDVHRRFGTRPLNTLPMVDIFTYKLYYRFVKGLRIVKPLNYIPYTKSAATEALASRFGWQSYAQKHHESRFTRFVECYWLPKKFGFDRRKAHLSSLVLTKQMTREEALERVSRPELGEQAMRDDFNFVAKKLSLTPEQLQELFDGPNRTYRDYRNKAGLIELGNKVMRRLGSETRLLR